jgi:hypothetical protein
MARALTGRDPRIHSLGFSTGSGYKETMRQRGTVLPTLVLGLSVAWGWGMAVADEPATPASSRSAPLDLRAPPITHVLTPAELENLTIDREEEPAPDVAVETNRYHVPVPVGFFRALPWAVMHPTQAWRVLTPVE